jgi:hypothetical protein
MHGIRQLFSWRGIRSWLSEHIGILLVAIASAYLVGFFLYHATVPVKALLWQKVACCTVGSSCALLGGYSGQVALAAADEAAYPITIWLWVGPDSSAGSPPPFVSCAPNVNMPD